jgi:NADPH:quinone reductase-like Zn-dependent oxidoreductase/nitrite reductase/ring-hydroxylating ferredoxin subunit
MSERQALCALDEIGDPGSRGFSYELGGETLQGFVVQRDGQLFAYRNSCPHTGAPLDWVDHRFLDRDEALIQCAVHDALFEIDSGLCVAGPCPGASLRVIDVEVLNGRLYLKEQPPQEPWPEPQQPLMNDLPKTMQGVYLTGHGGLDKLQWRDDIAVPIPGPRDVLVQVNAAGVNNTDLNTRIGWYSKSNNDAADAGWTGEPIKLPRIQGADVCGRVVAVGKQADSTLLNRRVLIEPCLWEVGGTTLEQPMYLGSECDGGFAQYTVVAARHAHPVDSPLSDIELASFPCSYSTAENLLTRSAVVNGDRVLVTGASGGVGSAVIQLARARGAKVVAVTSPSKVERILQLGAERTLARDDDYVTELGHNSMDVVIDLVAGAQWPSLLEVLKPFGRYAASGAIAGPLVELDVRTLYLKDLSLFGCTVLGPGVFSNLVRRIERQEIAPLVAATFPLAQIAEAQTQFASKQHIGKLVLDVAGNA